MENKKENKIVDIVYVISSKGKTPDEFMEQVRKVIYKEKINGGNGMVTVKQI